MPFPTVQRFQQAAEEFEALTGFPNVCSCIDGKHVRIKCPNSSGSLFYNYENYNSIHLQAIRDAKGKFLTIDIGDYGRRADSGVFFVESDTFRNIEHNILKFPPARVIDGLELSYVLLGDQGYPLKPYLMRPYSTGDDDDEGVYNCFLSKIRRSVECVFGMLVSKWGCLKTELQVNQDHVDTIVKTTCLLHNICIDFRESQGSQWFNPINRKNETASLSRRFNHSSQQANYIRDKFKNYIVRNIVHVTDA
ncbi:putative nuclease HARBI1 [Anopheles funestus]|uniref:putative nuclease HARBI1 n=1 Tax=Anopheles funestus TaxID=62324 RepID=UPI0020C67918|nr:putative nuclease HARBI1 [Anopheles funestus]